MVKQIYNEKQIKAVEMLAQGGYTYVEVAEACDVHVDTLRAWRKKEDFQEKVRKRARELLREAEPFLYKSALDAIKSDERAYQYQYIKLLLERIERLDAIAEGRGEQYEVMFTWKGYADDAKSVSHTDGAELSEPEGRMLEETPELESRNL